jgi:hypothetical protein
MRSPLLLLCLLSLGCGSSEDGNPATTTDTGAEDTNVTTGDTTPGSETSPEDSATTDSATMTDSATDTPASGGEAMVIFSDAMGVFSLDTTKSGSKPVKIAEIFSSVGLTLSPDGKRALCVKDNSALGQTAITVNTDGTSVMKELGLFNGTPIGWLDADTVVWFDKGASTVKASKFDTTGSKDIGKVTDAVIFRASRWFLSKDKKQIVVSDWKGAYVMATDGSATKRFDVGEATMPVWTADGHIVSSGSTSRTSTWLSALPTDTAFKKTTLPFSVAPAVTPWFPTDLVLVSAETVGMGGARITDMQTIKAVDGSSPTKVAALTTLGSLPENIVPSSDGKKVLYAKDKSVMTASIDGSGATPLHTSIANIQTVDW